ncbi:MAG: thioredoxin domain-containing protein [Alphaproteobacteria bacterium]|nr:thioredoxin domain-containing protein [Alphaproteobacteria bacterium]MBV9901708.1 thioredoxin domain-containing protein [Alphaproteobacteria bacterium]
MKALKLGGAAALALALAACGGGNGGNASSAQMEAPLAQVPAPQGDWTQVVSETPEGGFRMGNPNAPVKLVEYASLSCPFCAKFAQEGVPTLRDKYVKSGQVSWEYRTYMIHGTDPGVSLLVHCQGAIPAFRLIEELYATQPEWAGKVEQLPREQLEQLENLPPQQRMTALVRAGGLDEFFRQRGMPSGKIQSCLADQAGMDKLAAITALGNKEGVTGTPNFFINGRYLADTSDWRTLQPQLRGAIK